MDGVVWGWVQWGGLSGVLSGDHQGVLWGWVGRRGGLSGVCKMPG